MVVLVGFYMLQVCGHIKNVVVLVALRIRVVTSFVVNVPTHSFFTCIENFVDPHTAKTGLLRCCLYARPSVAVDRRQL